MREDKARAAVAALREQGVMAHVEQPGVYRFGIRVVIPDGRQAIWDTDGTAGLEAQIMRDNVLVGFISQIPGSEEFDEAQVVSAIAAADYGTG